MLKIRPLILLIPLFVFVSCSTLQKNDEPEKTDKIVYTFDKGISIISSQFSEQLSENRHKKIAIFGIKHHPTRQVWRLTAHIENGIIEEMSIKHKFKVIERTMLDALEKERKNASRGYMIGSSAGADIVITGTYSLWKEDALQTDIMEIVKNKSVFEKQTLRLNLKALDVASGVILGSAKVDMSLQSLKHLLY